MEELAFQILDSIRIRHSDIFFLQGPGKFMPAIFFVLLFYTFFFHHLHKSRRLYYSAQVFYNNSTFSLWNLLCVLLLNYTNS